MAVAAVGLAGCPKCQSGWSYGDVIVRERRKQGVITLNQKGPEMDAREYQKRAMATAFGAAASENRYSRAYYGVLKLNGEAGEVAEAFGKLVIREKHKDGGMDDPLADQEVRHALAEEVGDVLWYCALMADVLGIDLGQIMQDNLDKLAKRHG